MNLLIAGDFYVTEGHGAEDLLGPAVRALFRDADYRVVNLEAPITDDQRGRRIKKTGPHLHHRPDTVLPLLAELNINLVTLANNHIMDHGPAGLNETVAALKSRRMNAVGAGGDVSEAAKPFVLERDGLRIAFLNFAESEWSGATREKAGANPMDPIENARQIRTAKAGCDFVVAVVHGGYEDVHFPSPGAVKLYRHYAENGASAVVGHHPHCLGGFEVHEGTPIFYSLGNFVFTQPSKLDSWYTGLVLRLRLRRNDPVAWDLVPVAQSKNDYALTVLEGGERAAVLDEVAAYGRIIADEALLNGQWASFLSDWKRYYLNIFSPMNLVPSAHLKLGLAKLGLDRLFMRKKHYAEILNHMRCESHAEAARNIIERFLE